jgi:hypothetical protein
MIIWKGMLLWVMVGFLLLPVWWVLSKGKMREEEAVSYLLFWPLMVATMMACVVKKVMCR